MDGKLVVDTTYFQNRLTNFIDGSGNTAKNLPGTTRVDGIELTATAWATDHLKIDAAYTYTYAEDAGGTELTRRARHIASLNGTYDFKLWQRKAMANLGIRYNGTQTDQVFDSFSPSVKHTENLKGFTLLNAGFSWELRDNVELFARGENLLNQHYEEVFGYGTPGIGVFAGIKIKFGPTGM